MLENLGYSDKAIIALRRVLLQAAKSVQEGGEPPPHLVTDPKLNDFSRLRAVKGFLPVNGSWRELPDLEPGVA